MLAVQDLGAQAVVIAGMSGDSMLRMFEAAPHVLAQLDQLIVQPNQNVSSVRAWALRSGWHLRDERMLEERGRFFVVCAFVRAEGADPAYSVYAWTDAALCQIGPWFLSRKDVVALRWFEQQRTRVAHWVQRGVSLSKPELEVWEAACQSMRPRRLGSSAPPR